MPSDNPDWDTPFVELRLVARKDWRLCLGLCMDWSVAAKPSRAFACFADAFHRSC